MLRLQIKRFHQVRQGQTVRSIAAAFGVSENLLIQENALKEEVCEGQVLQIPKACGNVYTAQPGESLTLLCGSKERYIEQNGTDVLYPGMRVIL
jgi:hypothetical protein